MLSSSEGEVMWNHATESSWSELTPSPVVARVAAFVNVSNKKTAPMRTKSGAAQLTYLLQSLMGRTASIGVGCFPLVSSGNSQQRWVPCDDSNLF